MTTATSSPYSYILCVIERDKKGIKIVKYVDSNKEEIVSFTHVHVSTSGPNHTIKELKPHVNRFQYLKRWWSFSTFMFLVTP